VVITSECYIGTAVEVAREQLPEAFRETIGS